uniref:60S ribosomal protein L36 n=1 Tax=Heterorhabditis bacteriophora TaxID=37862 RepID=A0A1I7WWJ3_HETBA
MFVHNNSKHGRRVKRADTSDVKSNKAGAFIFLK